MKHTLVLVLSWTIISYTSCDEIDSLTFPDGFLFGVATSSYQTEGAWNESDKGISMFDSWSHTCPDCIRDRSHGDIACDSYHKYKEDITLTKQFGFNYYRFSISWARILPAGFTHYVNEEGIQHYKDIIKYLRKNSIEPMVTIYHYDHPQILEDMGGWTNELMVEWYADYARIIFQEFGPMVKIFTTVNEPQEMCAGYKDNGTAPGKLLPHNIGYYLCIHNLLKAHATAYHIYDEEFRASQNGIISINNPCSGQVLDDSNDTIAADTAFQFYCGMVGHPIYIGDYPPIVKKRVALVSKYQGYHKSRLPRFSPEWISYIKGTADYFALNQYTSEIVHSDPDEARGIYKSDSGIIHVRKSTWHNSSIYWLKSVPEGFGNLLRKIKDEYNNPIVYVTENGFPDHGELNDLDRINYFRSYLEELIIAVKRDDCRILSYTIWSLLDNWEFGYGYTTPFGIVKVNFNSTSRERTPKLSAYWWTEVIRTHRLQDVPKINDTLAKIESVWKSNHR
ncbi:myrosinase 1-like [Neodiprion virginianus]|uniref:myrosinase 1-like n=1 Tax=Neodiprion virginianus TaxID=2961670 RepID=UPI001EE75E86|nr:myrosinase 1-like [Neodiprion virginianus]